jgi:hypothetical protein
VHHWVERSYSLQRTPPPLLRQRAKVTVAEADQLVDEHDRLLEVHVVIPGAVADQRRPALHTCEGRVGGDGAFKPTGCDLLTY